MKSIKENFIFNLIKTICSIGFPIISFSYASRILGVEAYGRAQFSRSFISYFLIIANIGVNQYGVREIAKVRDDVLAVKKTAKEIFIINIISTIVSYILLAIIVLNNRFINSYIHLISIYSVMILLQTVGIDWLYQGLEEYKLIAIRSFCFQFFAMILLITFVKNRSDLYIYAVVSVISSSGVFFLNYIQGKKYLRVEKNIVLEYRKHIVPLLLLFAMAVSIELYTVLDSTMLGFIQGDVAVGKYTAAIKFNRMINSLITSITVIMIPRLSFYIQNNKKEEVLKLLDKAYNYIFLMSIPACIGMLSIANAVVIQFSGYEYASAGVTAKILAPIIIVIPFSMATNNQTFIPMGKEKLILISTLIGAITNFTCNMILIPKYSENGAAIATVLAESMVATVCYINARKFYCINRFFRYIPYYIAASLPIVFICYIIRMLSFAMWVKLLLSVMLSGCVYFLILLKMNNPFMMDIFSFFKNKISVKIERFYDTKTKKNKSN